MIFDLTTFTWIHTAISLIALLAGLVMIAGLLGSQTQPGWSALYLVTAVATSVTGFGFPFDKFLPSHWIGVISLVILAFTIPARYAFHYLGAWRWIYAGGIVITTYLLAFVTVVQAFQKIPAVTRLAPTQSEAPFALAQGIVLVLFVVLGFAAVRNFRATTPARAPA